MKTRDYETWCRIMAKFDDLDDRGCTTGRGNAETRRLAEKALASMDARRDEDIQAWAERLAADVAEADD